MTLRDGMMRVSILTGGKDAHYALGLLSALTTRDILVEFIANDEMKDSDAVKSKNVVYFNLRGDQNETASLRDKAIRVLRYYYKLIRYAAETESKIFHILWFNKFTHFDMTLLNLYYKVLGKKLVYTAHNINVWERDGGNSFLNRLFLSAMYKLVDHIFVHTAKMKNQLVEDFQVKESKISIISFPINTVIPKSDLTSEAAKKHFGCENHDKILLFFGNIAPYKGLDNLLLSLVHLKTMLNSFKLLIAGRVKDCDAYWNNVQETIRKNNLAEHILLKAEHIPDDSVEDYFKAADVLIVPYKYIYQSGVLFLSYHFGLPVIATDVGSLREDIEEGKTGYVCSPDDPKDLATKISNYFQSELYENLENSRDKIIQATKEKYSWNTIGEKSFNIYKSLLKL